MKSLIQKEDEGKNLPEIFLTMCKKHVSEEVKV